MLLPALPILRAAAALLLVAPLTACASIFRASAAPRAVSEAEIAQGKAALNTALAARDSAALAGLFAGGGLLVTPMGDTLRGGAAAAGYLLRPTPTPAFTRIDFTPELRLAECYGGGFERGRVRLVARALPPGEEHPVGRYRLQWRTLPGGGARIGTLSFLEADSDRDVPAEQCVAPAGDRFRNSRWSVAVFPGLIGLRGAAVGGAARDALAEQGWRDQIAVCGRVCSMHDGPRTTGHDTRPAVAMAAVTVRPRGQLVLTASAGAGVAGLTAGYETARRSKTVLRHESITAGVTAGLTMGHVEVGIGPAVQRLDWSLGETVFPQSVPVVAEAREWQVGALGRLRASLPVRRDIALEAMTELRLFPAVAMPAAGTVESAKLGTSSYAFALGVRYFR